MGSVVLLPIDNRDLDLLFAWSKMPHIWKYMTSSRKDEDLTWVDHVAWFFRHDRADGQRVDWMIVYEDKGRVSQSVGAIHIDGGKYHPPEIGLYIAYPNLWGKYIGDQALKLAIREAIWAKWDCLQAFIHPKNKRSIRLFTRHHFKKTGGKHNGLDIYTLDFRTAVRLEGPVRSVGASVAKDLCACPG